MYTLLLAIPWVGIFIGSVLQSSRGLLLRSVLVVVFVWSYFQPNRKKLLRILVLFFLGSVYVMFLLGFYRGRYSAQLSFSSRINRLSETITETIQSNEHLRPQALRVVERLYLVESIELIEFSDQYKIRDPWYSLDQLVYMYVPKFLYPEKGSGLQMDMLYKYGLVPVRHETSNVTVILLADAFFRWGMGGVMFIYGLTGVVLALLAKIVWARKDMIIACMLMGVIGYDAFYAFSSDVYNLFTWWLFEIPKLIIISIFILVVVRNKYLQ